MELRENGGLIFRNEKKSDGSPDYKGEIDVNGTLKEIALWVKEGKEGKKFFAVKISDPYNKESKPVEEPEDESDLPF